MLRSLTSIICLLGLSGCFLTEPQELLDVVVRPSDSIATAGTPFAFQVHIANRASQAVEIDAGTCPPRFRVLDEDGRRVRLPGILCPAIITGWIVLGPGESHLFSPIWLVPSRLSAGEYRLQAWVTPAHREPVLSHPVRLRVRAPSP